MASVLAEYDSSGSLRIHDLRYPIRQELCAFPCPHGRPSTPCEMAPVSNMRFAVLASSSAYVRDANTGTVVSMIDHGGDSVCHIAASSSCVAAATASGRVVLHHAATAYLLRELPLARRDKPVTALSFAPSGLSLVCTGPDQTIRVWDTGAAGDVRAYPAPEQCRDAVLSPDSRLLAAACGREHGHVVILGGRDSGCQLATRSACTRVCFSPDGECLASGDAGGELCLWNVATGVKVWSAATGSITALSFSDDGALLLANCRGTKPAIWDVSLSSPRIDFQVTSQPASQPQTTLTSPRRKEV
jgi:WD40 repeat protein